MEVLNSKNDVIKVNPNFVTETGQKVGFSDYFYVKLKKSKDYGILKRKAQERNIIIVEQNKFMPLWYTLRITKATPKNTLEVANEFYEMKIFSSSQPDFLSDDRLCCNDPMFKNMWGLNNKKNPNIDMDACQVWNITQGENIKVAVLDNGIFKEHIDLKTNLSLLSYNTETNSSPSQLLGDHGTHCAGTIAAIKDNGTQVVGISPKAKLIDVSNSLKGIPNSRIKRADGINWAWQNGADIISNSWGSSVQFQVIDEAIENAINRGRNGKGCIVVFASGNDNANVAYPANVNSNILSVGSITSEGRRSNFSNYGNRLDVVAPGSDILSTLPDNKIGYNSGTSMACPHVAGVAALILSANPNLTGKEVCDIIEKTAQKVGGYNYQTRSDKPNGSWNNEMGYGLVNAYKAVQYATIAGEDRVCAGKDITLELKVPIPQGATIKWEPNNKMYIRSGQGTKKCTFGTLTYDNNNIIKAIVTHNGNVKTYEKEIEIQSTYATSVPTIENHPNTPNNIPCCGGSNYIYHVICTSQSNNLEWENNILHKDPKDSFTFIIKEGGVDIQATRFTSTPFIVSTRARSIASESNPCGLTSDWSVPVSRYYGSIIPYRTSFRKAENHLNDKIFFSEYFMHRGNSLRIIKTDIYQWLDQKYGRKDLNESEVSKIVSILNNIDAYNNLNVKFFDISGRKLFEQNFNTNEDMIIDTSQLIKGMYVIYYICGDISHGKVIYKP
ncbi:MAG: S8 family serine peptidase [Capnocytophaga felis]|nr:S8 family serine peptidase [Capnocytophaga felis]